MDDPHHHPLVKTIVAGLRQRCGVREGQHLLIATSGGADSVALLRALTGLSPRRRWQLQLTVGHIDHALRPTSARDADFVKQLAQTLGLPCVSRQVDLTDIRDNLEAAARDARYAALQELANEVGADWIVTAHHSDDQLETLLMRLLRGTSVTGLTGIASVCGRVIRPMLEATHAQVLDYLHTIDQRWCEDETNVDTTYVRNRLRHDVLPILRGLRPDVASKAVQLADHARELGNWVNDEIRIHTPSRKLDRAAARAMPPLLLTGVLRQMLIRAGVDKDDLAQSTLDAITRAAHDREGGERTFDLAGGVTLNVQRDAISIL